MKNIIASLDKLADHLQAKGLNNLAESVDSVTNTLETIPEVETEVYKEKWDLLRLWLTTMNQSVLARPGNSVEKLFHLVARKVLTHDELLNTNEWKNYYNALKKIESTSGPEIPADFFRPLPEGRKPRRDPFRWEELSWIADVLDIHLLAAKPGEDRQLDMETFTKQHAAPYHSPAFQAAQGLFKTEPDGRVTEKLNPNDLFRKKANIILDSKLLKLEALIKSLHTR